LSVRRTVVVVEESDEGNNDGGNSTGIREAGGERCPERILHREGFSQFGLNLKRKTLPYSVKSKNENELWRNSFGPLFLLLKAVVMMRGFRKAAYLRGTTARMTRLKLLYSEFYEKWVNQDVKKTKKQLAMSTIQWRNHGDFARVYGVF
jgi:hypothetical protein